jgi:hypothetical protein
VLLTLLPLPQLLLLLLLPLMPPELSRKTRGGGEVRGKRGGGRGGGRKGQPGRGERLWGLVEKGRREGERCVII